MIPQGLKPHYFMVFTARLKSCPDTYFLPPGILQRPVTWAV